MALIGPVDDLIKDKKRLLVVPSGPLTALEKTRARYLEEKLEAAFQSALPGADVKAGAKWRKGDQDFEIDLLVAVDRTVIIAVAVMIGASLKLPMRF